jgi:hypothetical protein
MTKRYAYALKTIMILYDGLPTGCQGDFVTSFVSPLSMLSPTNGERAETGRSGSKSDPTENVSACEPQDFVTNFGAVVGQRAMPPHLYSLPLRRERRCEQGNQDMNCISGLGSRPGCV